MRRPAIVAATAAAASFVLAPAAGASAEAPTTCARIAVANGGGADVYRIATNGGCGAARDVLRVAIARPVFAAAPHARVDGWSCRLWRAGEPWTISCARGAVVATASGPVATDDPWIAAAARAGMPVLEPLAAAELGFALQQLSTKPSCSSPVRQHEASAVYRGPGGSTLTAIERKPPCGNVGESAVIAHWRLAGTVATLSEGCAGPVGCSRSTNDYVLHWQQRADDVVLIARGVPQSTLLAFARSMTVVAH